MSMMLYKFGIWDRLVSPGAGLQNIKLSAMKWGGEACRSRRTSPNTSSKPSKAHKLTGPLR